MACSHSTGLGYATRVDETNRILIATITIPDSTLNDLNIKRIVTTPWRCSWGGGANTGSVNLDIAVVNLELRSHNRSIVGYSKGD